MNTLESNKLFKSIQIISNEYKNLNIEYSDKLQDLFLNYKSNINMLKSRVNLISSKTREESKNSSKKDIYTTAIELNNFALDKYKTLKLDAINIDDLSLRYILLNTLDELILINESIRNKDFLNDKNTYFYIYEKIVVNGFLNFLVLKDINLDSSIIECLSQGILSQIQSLSLVSL